MTLSIAALCPRTGQFGVGALTAMLGAGKLVTHARPGVGAVDREARAYAWTGRDIPDWAGHRLGEGYAVQGNRLVGEEAVDESDHAVRDLRQTYARFLEELMPVVRKLPTRANPRGGFSSDPGI